MLLAFDQSGGLSCMDLNPKDIFKRKYSPWADAEGDEAMA
jgi:hypothetical protein